MELLPSRAPLCFRLRHKKIGHFLRFSKKTEKLQEWENMPNFAPHQPEL